LVDERFARLVAQQHEARLVAQEAAEAISSDLKSLETRQAEIENDIDASTSALLDAEDKVGKARDDQEEKSSLVQG